MLNFLVHTRGEGITYRPFRRKAGTGWLLTPLLPPTLTLPHQWGGEKFGSPDSACQWEGKSLAALTQLASGEGKNG